MKNALRYSFIALAAVLVLSSCSKKPKLAKYMPKETGYVVAIDPKSLQGKLASGNLSMDSIIKKYSAKVSDSSVKIFNNIWAQIKESGLNWNEKMMLGVENRGSIMEGNTMVVNFLAELDSEDKWKSFLAKVFDGMTPQQGKGYFYIQPEEAVTISWNGKIAIATLHQAVPKGGYYDTVTNSWKTPVNEGVKQAALKDLERMYTLKEKESLAGIKEFATLMSEDADAFFFSNSNGFASSLENVPMMPAKLKELLKDNYSTATINFEEGKITSKSKSHLNSKMASLLSKYAGPTINTELLENYPSANVNGLMAVSFKPEIFSGLLKEIDMESMAQSMLQSFAGIDINDIYKCLKGDIAVVVSDFSIPSAANAGMIQAQPKAGLIFNAPIGDKASLDKVLAKAVETGIITKDASGNYAAKMEGMHLKIDAKNIYVTSDSALLASYLAKTQKMTLPAGVMDKIKGKSMSMYINLQSIIKAIPVDGTNQDNFEKMMFDAFKNTFNDVIMYSENLKGKTIEGDVVVRMMDEKKNSLVGMVSMITAFADAAIAEEEKNKANVNTMLINLDSARAIEDRNIQKTGKKK